jgi:hypothetical protein
MARLVEQVLDAIGDENPEAVADGIRLAVSLFEHSHGQTEVYHKEVLAEPASPADMVRIRRCLVDLVQTGAPAPLAGAAVFALGKAYDPSLITFFTEVLRDYLHSDAGVLYQAMIALDNLGVSVFADRCSALAEDENRALATEFLRHCEGY